MGDIEDLHRQELRRGTVVLACLLLLRRPGYGYGLLEALQERGFDTDANTLYPLLRRLEKQGYLSSDWDTEGARPRKFYTVSATGRALTDVLIEEWDGLTSSVSALTEENR